MDKLPDKIYISHLCDTTIDGEEGYLMAMSFEDNGGEKFIRKDALLEWAENWGKYKLRTDDGFLYAMELLINKLNSL